jgi:hypothetical protein
MSMDKLERIGLRDNLLGGRIPANLGSCRSLIEFCIQSNRIEGEVPQSIGDLEELRFFEANNNLLAGEIPTTISNCQMLEAFRVRANQLHGCIPMPSLRKLEKLQYISMMDNGFCGATISTCTHEEVDPRHWTELAPTLGRSAAQRLTSAARVRSCVTFYILSEECAPSLC